MDRRRFIQGSLAAGLGLAYGGERLLAQPSGVLAPDTEAPTPAFLPF